MIQEFALDPELIALAATDEGYRLLMTRFGLDARRLISRFPDDWERTAARVAEDSGAMQEYPRKARIVEVIEHLKKHWVQRESEYDKDVGWVANAARENQRAGRQFDGVVAASNPANDSSVKVIRDPAIAALMFPPLPHDAIVDRRAEDMAALLAPMLRRARQMLFVDPYFNPEAQRFRAPLTAFLGKATANRTCGRLMKVGLHTTWKGCPKRFNELDIEQKAQKLEEIARDKLPICIPPGLTMTVSIWKEKCWPQAEDQEFDRLHNRYVLTDVGGVMFGTGLDEGVPGPGRDIVCALSAGVYQHVWRQYAGSPAVFLPARETFSVVGAESASWR
jgi:hypothetical protein